MLSRSILTQLNGCTACLVTVITSAYQGWLLQQVLQSPQWSLWKIPLKLNCNQISARKMLKQIGPRYRLDTVWEIVESRIVYYNSGKYSSRFVSNVWFSDESHINLNGFINQQITRFICLEWPNTIVKNLSIVSELQCGVRCLQT